ncbi:MAG: type II toxin-antitoxin system HicB family antitoxin [Desulfovibrio sp.]|nr:type II toxin-antitoxin system HicB family antitoxin [Desulfovibrio sp.]
MERGMIDVKVEFLPPDEKEGRECWVAVCPEINLATQGDSFEEATQNIREAMYEWLRFCLEYGTLEAALVECGFQHYRIEKIRENLPIFAQGNSRDDFLLMR